MTLLSRLSTLYINFSYIFFHPCTLDGHDFGHNPKFSCVIFLCVIINEHDSSHDPAVICRCERKNLAYFRQKNRKRQIAQKLPSLFEGFLSI